MERDCDKREAQGRSVSIQGNDTGETVKPLEKFLIQANILWTRS
jgi:hypothetical protein